MVLKPWLEAKLRESFPDPVAFKNTAEFTYAALASSAFKKVVAEILMYVDQQKLVLETLQQKQRGELKSKFKVGA